MNKDAQKNMMLLAVAGAVLVAVNTLVWLGAKSGRVAPIENIPLWGIFVVLNTCSLLWAISLLGVQPMVVAVSYLAGAFLAYQGVRLVPEVNIAEVTTAGATYGAFGALVIGNAGTKVRLAFFNKAQIPFVFIIAALLVVDAFLNSRISHAGWNVILNALVFPFVLAGVIVGLLWFVLAGLGVGKGIPRKALVAVEEDPQMQALEDEPSEAAGKLMFQVPARDGLEDEEPEEIAAAIEIDEPAATMMEAAVDTNEEKAPVLEKELHNDFFPLEIDKDDSFILPMDDSGLIDVAAMVAEGVSGVDEDPVYLSSIIEEPAVPEPVAAPAAEPIATRSSATEPDARKQSDDWLSGHLELLKKINK